MKTRLKLEQLKEKLDEKMFKYFYGLNKKFFIDDFTNPKFFFEVKTKSLKKKKKFQKTLKNF